MELWFFFFCTLSDGGLYFYKVSWKYSGRYRSSKADTNFIRKISKNSVKNIGGVPVLVLCTSSDDGLYLYPVSWKYLEHYQLWSGHKKLTDGHLDRRHDIIRPLFDRHKKKAFFFQTTCISYLELKPGGQSVDPEWATSSGSTLWIYTLPSMLFPNSWGFWLASIGKMFWVPLWWHKNTYMQSSREFLWGCSHDKNYIEHWFYGRIRAGPAFTY